MAVRRDNVRRRVAHNSVLPFAVLPPCSFRARPLSPFPAQAAKIPVELQLAADEAAWLAQMAATHGLPDAGKALRIVLTYARDENLGALGGKEVWHADVCHRSVQFPCQSMRCILMLAMPCHAMPRILCVRHCNVCGVVSWQGLQSPSSSLATHSFEIESFVSHTCPAPFLPCQLPACHACPFVPCVPCVPCLPCLPTPLVLQSPVLTSTASVLACTAIVCSMRPCQSTFAFPLAYKSCHHSLPLPSPPDVAILPLQPPASVAVPHYRTEHTFSFPFP
ncbi:unnamed protein product [Closterium sp. NIES-53]